MMGRRWWQRTFFTGCACSESVVSRGNASEVSEDEADFSLLSETEDGEGPANIAVRLFPTLLAPDSAEAHLSRGQSHWRAGERKEAIASYEKAVKRRPRWELARVHLGDALKAQGQNLAAISEFQELLALDPDNVDNHVRLADACWEAGDREHQAVTSYKRAVELSPENALLHANLGALYQDLKQFEEAIPNSIRALEIDEDCYGPMAHLVYQKNAVCDWEGRDKMLEDLRSLIEERLDDEILPEVNPLEACSYPLEAGLVKRLVRAYAEDISDDASVLGCPELSLPPRVPLAAPDRIRVAYVSSDFKEHPVGDLMGSVFGLHDRAHFEIFVYALTSVRDRWGTRIASSSEHFLDVSAWDPVQIAERISADGIHIAVNLNGFTKGARNEAFALRCAPLQIMWLGWAATSGDTEWTDYTVADPVAVPPHLHDLYAEPLAFMPNCLVCTDYKQAHQGLLKQPPSRREAGLPENAVVFACTNQVYKLDPDTFSTWCRILQRVPNSVLWVLRAPRLKEEARKRGVDPARIIFTDFTNKTEHIRRSMLPDIFLDTPAYNACTTGCDVLWAGCPIVTMPLERMASRLGSSVCAATGLGDQMIVNSLQEYEERAVELGTDHAKRRALRAQLASARNTCALFDTHTWVRDFERVLTHMWDRYVAGEEPATFHTQPMPPVAAEARRPVAPYPPSAPQGLPAVQAQTRAAPAAVHPASKPLVQAPPPMVHPQAPISQVPISQVLAHGASNGYGQHFAWGQSVKPAAVQQGRLLSVR
mmetsp:Transcript_120309/g.220296  ORF Transcript_120309/g.220296 Transcript_120309/m.220296 type:complete len:766 (+) Transcript_120309:120-2417(+)